nr:helix-turn-helix transcriptional regulator [uncultured Lichenicoccus sp.]
MTYCPARPCCSAFRTTTATGWRPATPWEFFWICLNGSEVLRLWRQLLETGRLVRLGVAGIDRLAQACASVLEGEASPPAHSSQLAYSIAMQLADEMLAWGEVRTSSKRPAAIDRAVSLVHAGAAAPVDVGRIAAASGYSRYHFSRLFSAIEWMPPARYRLRVRMEEAARRLQTEPHPINVVADCCGVADANYFTKLFRRFYGMTPRDFRRSGMFAGSPPPQVAR